MKIAVFAKGARALRCLVRMEESGFRPESVLVQDDDPSLAGFAGRAGIRRLSRPEEILASPLDLLILAGYTRIIREPLISHARLGAVNLHGGRLPHYRGASVLNWQIINGETECGVAVLAVDDGIDTGDILAEARFPIAVEDTFTEVSAKAAALFPDLLVGVVRDLRDGKAVRIRQDRRAGAYYHKRVPEDGRISWGAMTARRVHDFVRALARPCPGAFSFIGGRKLTIWKTRLWDAEYRGIPGRLVRFDKGCPVVIAQDRGLALVEWRFENENDADSRRLLKSLAGGNFS